ncbi:MAG: aliphatic sulfonate ABC transporter substrate-binding protein [Lachnospiraceae bacterium]|nr:aliphatic sulfonate ABC transporter substrate-binding protein [Lachnospiraceae bacterium]
MFKRRFVKKAPIAAALACMAVMFTAGCGGNDDNTVNIGFFPNITHAQALLAMDSGRLEEELGDSYKVEWTSFNAGPAEVEALVAQEIDIGYIGPVPAINANVKTNGEISVLSNACDAGAVLIKRSDVDINSVQDLAGKTVAIPQVGNTQHLCLLSLLEENGLKSTEEGGDVTIVAVENAQLQTMFEKGHVDAALPPEPWGSILERNCGAQVVLGHDEIMLSGNYPTAVVIARNEFMDSHPEVVEKFLGIHSEMTDYFNNNKDEAAGIINNKIEELKGKKYEVDILKSAFERLTVSTDIRKDAMDVFIDMCEKQEFISSKPDTGLLYR